LAQTFVNTIPNSGSNILQTAVDSRNNELALQSNFSGTSFPGSAVAGQTCYRTDLNAYFTFNGILWGETFLSSTMGRDIKTAYGSMSNLTNRLNVSLNADGSLKLPAVMNFSSWIDLNQSYTYVSANSFTIPGDWTGTLTPAKPLRLTCNGAFVYSYVASIAYAAGVSTVTTLDSTLVSPITALQYGILDNYVGNAKGIIFTPSGNITSYTVQDALVELDAEKLANTTSFTGDFNLKSTGGYYVTSTTGQSNAPNSTDTFLLSVMSNISKTFVVQQAVGLTSGVIYNRQYNTGAWSVWDVMPTMGTLPTTNRNRIINGDMKIAQRGNTQALSSSAAYGSLDRWWALMSNSAAGSVNVVAISDLVGYSSCAKLNRTSASALTNSILFGQIIESANCYSLQGKTVTLSFYAKAGANFSSSSGVLNSFIVTGTGVDQGLSSLSASTWTGQTTASTKANILTTSWQRFTQTVTLGVNISEISVQFGFTPVGTAGADDSFYITGVQLEDGYTATAFEFLPVSHMINLCLRYYERLTLHVRTYAAAAGSHGIPVSHTSKRVIASSSVITAPTYTNASAASCTPEGLNTAYILFSMSAAGNSSITGYVVGLDAEL
jgi:hypothetical protein